MSDTSSEASADDKVGSEDKEGGNDPRIAEIVALAEGVLRESWGGPVRLELRDVLRERYRNRVLRLAVAEGPADAPPTVIAKTSEAGEEGFDPDKEAPGNAAWRFYNEWTGNAFLSGLAAEPPLSAKLYGGSREAGLFVLEDLGAARSLADCMTADDAPALESALRSYATSMGRLHAATVGRHAEFAALRQSLGGGAMPMPGGDIRGEWLQKDVPHFRALCEQLEVTITPGFDDDVEAIAAGLSDPGPFLAFAPGDTCPDNHRIQDDGSLRFFDFEFTEFRHALLDAAYFYMPFPTCWCVNRLPEPMVAMMETAYRQALAPNCPDALDDDVFLPALSWACGFWAVATIHWGLEEALKADGPWGISSARQRPPVRLGNFCRVAERAGTLPALTETAWALARTLRARWEAETDEMPLYPPFRPSD